MEKCARTEERAERFLSALDEMLDAGCEWEGEIQRELEDLDPEELAGFLKKAGLACSVLGGIAGNMLTGAEVRLAVPATVATAGGAR